MDTSQLKKLMIIKIFSVNPLYLISGEVDGFIEQNNRNKNLVFLIGQNFIFTDENKEVFKKYVELWDGIKNEIETINSDK